MQSEMVLRLANILTRPNHFTSRRDHPQLTDIDFNDGAFGQNAWRICQPVSTFDTHESDPPRDVYSGD